MGDCIAIRILGDKVDWEYDKSLRIIQEFAKWSHVPVINMEDNIYHPCQGMADVMTLREMYGRDLRGRKLGVTWTWGSSPKKPIAPHHDFHVRCQPVWRRHRLLPARRKCASIPTSKRRSRPMSKPAAGRTAWSDKMEDACENADIVYAKNYVCPGSAAAVTQKPEQDEMVKLFGKYKDWIADEKRMNMAKPTAQYMHCLPCERGAEVSDAVLDGKWGVACFNEAENRLHAQKGVMACIIP